MNWFLSVVIFLLGIIAAGLLIRICGLRGTNFEILFFPVAWISFFPLFQKLHTSERSFWKFFLWGLVATATVFVLIWK